MMREIMLGSEQTPTDSIKDIYHLEDMLSSPTPELIDAMSHLAGDVLVLGAGGKMGPTLCRMVRSASDGAGTERRVIGVSRFSNADEIKNLNFHGVETIRGDLLDPEFVDSLPEAPNVIYMAGMKFGSSGNEAMTWAMNTHLPSLICHRYRDSCIGAFSTGNVYGLSSVNSDGSKETEAPNPIGEYAMSCLGRERMFEHFSQVNGTRVVLFRLNYAIEMRYGVLLDMAIRVWNDWPIDLGMGAVNVIWQADANAMAVRALAHASSPPAVLNIAGPDVLHVRQVCERFGELFGKHVGFSGVEASDALLSNGGKAYRTLGVPRIGPDQMIRWVADWVQRGEPTHGKPTHFEVRDGNY